MGKTTIDGNLFSLPRTQSILGTHLKGKVNFVAVGWLTRVDLPPLDRPDSKVRIWVDAPAKAGEISRSEACGDEQNGEQGSARIDCGAYCRMG